MELSGEEVGEIPLPISSAYMGVGHGHGHGHGHMIHHDPTPQNHIIPCSAPQLLSNGPIQPTLEDHHMSYKKLAVRYRDCLKNHAAAIGGNATDGCGEFMPSGEEGSLEALKCSACNCHRNFHRKETDGDSPFEYYPSSRMGRKIMVGHHKVLSSDALGYHTGTLISSRAPPSHHHMIMSYNLGGSIPSESDEQDGGIPRPVHMVKKRFRTKFTPEQKEKMLNFAEKIGWRIQKPEEAEVLQFCQEIGVKRRVLKVWMHNNKHNLAKKNNSASTA